MVLGFNHNIQYKGEIFHIQTEDSGIETPHIITLIYRGGVIVSSKKTGYHDIIKMDNLEKVVEDLMKEQHKEMLRRLKSGEFDERAFGSKDDSKPEASTDTASPPPAPRPSVPDAPLSLANEGTAKTHQSLDEIILDYLVTGEDL